MEIVGKCIQLLDEQVYQSKRVGGGSVVKNGFVIDTGGQYAKRVCFVVFGREKFVGMGIEVGKSYGVSFDVESREWQGRWFTECLAWKVVCVDSSTVAASSRASESLSSQSSSSAASGVVNASNIDVPSSGEPSDNLPF